MKFVRNFILVLVVTFLLAEAILQAIFYYAPREFPGSGKKGSILQKALHDYVERNILTLWARSLSEKKTFYEPPFHVFVNRDFDDKVRLSEIAKRSKLPLNSTQTQQDFLRLNKTSDTGLFTVRTNQLGFRGAEATAKKPANTYRIIVLGSYPAFGHAVNDNQTYPYYLEKILNGDSKNKTHFEVWNGGLQGASSIMGIARLENEIADYKPDLIIWDFGWVEMFLLSDVTDDYEKFNRLRSAPRPNAFIRTIYRGCHHMMYSLLCRQFVNKVEKVGADEAIAGWDEAMERLKSWSKKMNVPVIFLRHPGVAVPKDEYKKYDSPVDSFFFLKTDKVLKEPLTESESSQFWGHDNWVSEMGFKKEDAEKEMETQLHADALQFNEIAYQRFAKFISGFIAQHKAELKIPVK